MLTEIFEGWRRVVPELEMLGSSLPCNRGGNQQTQETKIYLLSLKGNTGFKEQRVTRANEVGTQAWWEMA